MAIEIRLPEDGTFAKELVVTSLLGFGEIGLNIEGNVAYIRSEQAFRDRLRLNIAEIISQATSSKKKGSQNVSESDIIRRIVGANPKYHKEFYDITSSIFRNPELFFENDSNDYFLPIFFPDVMEAERWYGGWGGTGKGEKRTSGVNRQSAILGIIALHEYEMISYKDKGENYSVLALVDTTIMSDACSPQSGRIQGVTNFEKLSHVARLLILSSNLSENGCQEIVVLKKGVYRTEIYEKNPRTFIFPLIEFWRRVHKNLVYSVFTKIINKDPSMFNSVSNYIFEGIKGSLKPEEVTFMIARETFMRDESVVILPNVMQMIRKAIGSVTASEAYST